jgi:hypothetical protein
MVLKTSLDLDGKNVNRQHLAEKALKNDEILTELLECLLSKTESIRFNSFETLLLLSEEHPERLYPKWEFFTDFLSSQNTYHKYIAIYILANLTTADKGNKFEKIFEKYYDLLDDKSLIAPSHVAKNSGKIILTKPDLMRKITEKLLSIDRTHHRLDRKALIKGYAIEAFDEYFKKSGEKSRIVKFVKSELNSLSPTTQKKAKAFMAKWIEAKSQDLSKE